VLIAYKRIVKFVLTPRRGEPIYGLMMGIGLHHSATPDAFVIGSPYHGARRGVNQKLTFISFSINICIGKYFSKK